MEINDRSDISNLRDEQRLLIVMSGRLESLKSGLVNKNRSLLSPRGLKSHCSLAALGFAMRFKTAELVISRLLVNRDQ